MLTVIIQTLNHEDALAHTLASLVGGAVDGVVKDVLICDGGSTDSTESVAEHAGCTWLDRPDTATALRRAKGEWLLMLEPGARVGRDWTEAALRHAAEFDRPARLTPSSGALSGALRLLRRPLADGLVISKRRAFALSLKLGSAPRFGVSRLRAQIDVASSR